MGKRPDYATIVYCNLIRQVYKKTPVIIGGIEASLRRMAHYDYWSDKVKRSILIDSGADIISYGMGEHSIIEIADALNAGIDIHDITFIKGTVYKTKTLDNLENYIELPSYDDIVNSKEMYAKSFYTQYKNTDPFTARILVEKVKEKCMLCKTHQLCHLQKLKWMISIPFHICVIIILCMKRMVAYLLYQK